MRLLIVEDNEKLATLLVKGLQSAGYDCDHFGTAGEAQSALATTSYAAMILDLGLPDSDGLSVLRDLRHRNDSTPVLLLTARGGLQDRVTGLRSGADDYLVKPFALEELVARLEAQIRRPGQLLGHTLRVGNLEFDTRNRQCAIDGAPQVLSARETAVLEILMRGKGRVVSKRQVEDSLFGSPAKSPRMPSRSMCIACANNWPTKAQAFRSTPFAVWATSSLRTNNAALQIDFVTDRYPACRGRRADVDRHVARFVMAVSIGHE